MLHVLTLCYLKKICGWRDESARGDERGMGDHLLISGLIFKLGDFAEMTDPATGKCRFEVKLLDEI